MSSRYHFAEAITGSCIKQVTKSAGGKTYTSMRVRSPRTFGNKLIQRMGGLIRKLNRPFIPAKQRLRINGYGKTNYCKSTKCQTQHRNLEQNPGNAARGDMPSATDLQQKP